MGRSISSRDREIGTLPFMSPEKHRTERELERELFPFHFQFHLFLDTNTRKLKVGCDPVSIHKSTMVVLVWQ